MAKNANQRLAGLKSELAALREENARNRREAEMFGESCAALRAELATKEWLVRGLQDDIAKMVETGNGMRELVGRLEADIARLTPYAIRGMAAD